MIGDNIKNIRKHKKITQKQLAKSTGLSISYIQQLEYGTRLNPTFDTISLISEALNISVDELTNQNREGSKVCSSMHENLNDVTIKDNISNVILNISEKENIVLDDEIVYEIVDDVLKYIEFLIYKSNR